MKLKRAVRDAVIILGITLMLLLVVEGAVRLVMPQSKRVVFKDGQTAGVKTSGGFYRMRVNHSYTSINPEFEVSYTTNGEGMRDANSYLGKPRDRTKKRLLLLGDSFTFGEGSEYEQTWGYLTERNLNAIGTKCEIIKAGVPGYDTRTELEYLTEIIDLYQPDLVMVGFMPNDLFTNMRYRPKGEPRAGNASQARRDEQINQVTGGGKSHGFNLQSVTLAKRAVIRSDALYCGLYGGSMRGGYFSTNPTGSAKTQYEITQELFKQMQELCRAKGARLVVISIPQQYQVFLKALNRFGADDDADAVDQQFIDFARMEGITWIKTLDNFSRNYVQTKNDLFYRYDGHLRPAGNKTLTDAIVPELASLLR